MGGVLRSLFQLTTTMAINLNELLPSRGNKHTMVFAQSPFINLFTPIFAEQNNVFTSFALV